MSKIKHWDEASQSWVIDAASNASNLELSNPGFIDEEGKPISIDHGFTKIDNRLTKIEKNLAWVYLNGAKGGTGGGPGGGTDVTYTLSVAEGSTVYTSTSSAKINVTISSGTVKKAFTLTAKNLSNNQIIGTWKLYSLTRTPITLSNLTGTTDIELSAYDSNNNYTTPTYVKVVAGAISLSIQNVPNKTIYIGGVSEVLANFTVTNNITGSPAAFVLTTNGKTIDTVTGINTSIRSLSYNIRDIIFNSGEFTPVSGQKFKFTAYATTILSTETLTSNIITFEVTVADSNNLVIVTEEISDFIPSETPGQTYEDLTEYPQGSQLGFSYYLSYGLTKYSTFNIDYSIYTVSGGVETLIKEGEILNVYKGETNRFVYSTVNIDPTLNGDYLKIVMFGYASSDAGDVTAQYTKNVYCRIIESDQVPLYANNDIHTLLAYYSKVSGFNSTTIGTWNYPLPTSGPFIYEGAFRNKFPNGVNLTLKGVNGVTSGFLTNTDGINDIPGIVLNGESYGYLEVANQMFPNVDISSGISFFQQGGFNISCTFKAEPSSYPDETILSIAKYENDELKTGFEISLEKVRVKIGSADSIVCRIPQNELITVDLDVSLFNGGWYFKVYVNGVLSAVSRVQQNDIDWQFAQDLYLGCRNDNGIRSRFSNVTFYDIKVYTSSQSEFAIVQNYMSAHEQALLLNGEINPNLDAELRAKNLFDASGNCLVWDKTANSGKGEFIDGEMLYNKLLEQMNVNTPYPLVLIEETSSSSTLFEAYSTAIFSASEKETIMSKKFPVKITYTDQTGRVLISTPSGVNVDNGVSIGLQGTSSLSYNAKNFEIYMGDADATGKKMLFQPRTDWLPENEFTLKADVMDSAHVNNVAIGQIINGVAKNLQGQTIKPFENTPPMSLGNDVWGGDTEKAESIRGKIKHTSEGFPCLVFIRYAPDEDGNIKAPKFCGIYNFNLGRYAFYNLGLKIMTDYTRQNADGPTLVTEYTELTSLWNTGVDNGVYSVEINQNSSAQGAFQQDDIKIVKFMGDVVHTSRDEETAYTQVQKLYNQLANMALGSVQKYTMDDAGQTPTKPIVGEFYNYNSSYYKFSAFDERMNWNNACAYFTIGIVFGMVDSMCKNLTLRNWGSNVWHTAFYDMDTAFGLNNAGQDAVDYWAHMHRWYNIRSGDTGISTTAQEKNYPDGTYRQHYGSWWNRIWEVLENLATLDSGAVGTRTSIESMYINLRTNLFPDPEAFIDKYYKSYTEKTGSIMFNYDYKIKYLKIAQTYNSNTGEYTDSTDFTQLKFLHGNRVMHVRDWFKRRVLFLDGVYGFRGNTVTIPSNVKSPVTSLWASNKTSGSSAEIKFGVKMAASSKVLYHYSYGQIYGSYWLSESPEDFIVPMPAGSEIVYVYAKDYITKFDNFKNYLWIGLNNIDLPLLEELDLTNLKNVPYNDFFVGGVYSNNPPIGLKNIKTLILSGVTLSGDGASAYDLNLSNCQKIQKLDVSNSSITKITLPDKAVLKELNLSGTDITTLNLSNQTFLHTLNITNCEKLTSITLTNCASLKTLVVPRNVTSINIINCESLETLMIPYTSVNNSISPLTTINVDNCPGLKSFDINGQNNPTLSVNLVGAWNLESLTISGTNLYDLQLASLMENGVAKFKSLKSLNISKTDTKFLKFNDITYDYLDLTAFPDLDNISASNCSQLVRVKCLNNPDNPISLQSSSFYGCSSLTSLQGHFLINGTEIFKGCSALRLNDASIYDANGFDVFLPGGGVCNLTISPVLSSLLSEFESCNSLTYGDFRYIMLRLTPAVSSLESTFKNCSNINGEIWRDLFRNCPNVTNIKEAFSGCKLSGIFYSRTSNYNPSDDYTWGILDFAPNLLDAESSFESTNLEWIDNNIFSPAVYNGVTTYPSLVRIDRMFRSCSSLKTCVYTRALPIVQGNLNSETFFINLRNLISVYPKEVFSGCVGIKMNVINDANGNTLLFHTLKDTTTPLVLNNSLYTGITLVGSIKPNVFGGISQTIISENNTYKIPTFTSIQYPFSGSGGTSGLLTVKLSEMGDMFSNIGSTLLQAVGVFTGVTCSPTDSTIIPPNIFKGCVKLNSIESFFSGLDLHNNHSSYTFPPKYMDNGVEKGMFDDCISLQITKNLFAGCYNLKMQLVGEGFKNCILSNVSGMFKNSGVYGTIPYRLFFMDKLNPDGSRSLVKTITDMENIFQGCWYLGYDYNRKISIGQTLDPNLGTQTMWENHIVEVPGNRVSFKLNMSDIQKVYNHSTNTYEYDSWYLDGYGWEGATSLTDQVGLDAFKQTLFSNYLSYDEQQKLVIEQQNGNTPRYIKTVQNYMIPTDLFRYCSSSCTLINVLSNLSWYENKIDENLETGEKIVIKTNNIEGLRGRIPCKLFESLTNSLKFENVFKDTFFDAFVGLQSNTIIPGMMYPPDLFKYNSALEEIPYMFAKTFIPVGVKVNSNLFANNPNLRNITGCWSDCVFDKRSYNAETAPETSQFDFLNLFINNTRISNASALFAVYTIDSYQRGLYKIEKTLLQNSYNINNISNMFYYNSQMSGEVPEFPSASYIVLNSVTGYLVGCTRGLITNESTLEVRLKPEDWLN